MQSRKPGLVGSLVTSPQDIHSRLKQFKTRLAATHGPKLSVPAPGMVSHFGKAETSPLCRPRLYFVKVDVKACYDTIDQAKLLSILSTVMDEVRHHPSPLPRPPAQC